MNDIANLINTMGYPISVSIGVGYVLYKVLKILLDKFIETLDKITKTNEKLVETNHTFIMELTQVKNDIKSVDDKVEHIILKLEDKEN